MCDGAAGGVERTSSDETISFAAEVESSFRVVASSCEALDFCGEALVAWVLDK